MVRRVQPDTFTISQLSARWGRSEGTIRGWVYRRKILKALPSSVGRGRRLRFSLHEVQRFERDYEGIVREQPAQPEGDS